MTVTHYPKRNTDRRKVNCYIEMDRRQGPACRRREQEIVKEITVHAQRGKFLSPYTVIK